MINLSVLFADWMILQRDTDDNLIWGYSDKKSDVSIILKNSSNGDICFESKVSTNEDGLFETKIGSYGAGGDYIIEISDEDEKKTIEHVTFGDVFVCGGQSNMELMLNRTLERYEEELKTVYDENIRYFKVLEKYNFHNTEEMLTEGKWKYVQSPQIYDFGAVAYFLACELRKLEDVPIGIYNTAIGGTPIKSWCCEKTMHRLGLYEEEFEQCLDDEFVAETIKREAQEDISWRQEADEAFSQPLDNCQKGTVNMPSFFEDIPELAGKIMAIYMHKDVEVPESFTDQEVKLYLGALIDSDKTYVNGELVGETGYLYPPRIYKLSPGVLKKGKNRIDIRLLVFRDQGGFMPGMNYKLKTKSGEEISLEGEWDYEIVKEMPYFPNLTFFAYKATGVFNGMIYPLRRQKVLGVFFYQGESNVGDYKTYKEEFESCIKDWRDLWNNSDLPFIFVQIASWCEGRKKFGDMRAYLADEQRKCTELPQTAMVQAYDLGEYNDLHPTNKKEVGRRLALAAEDLVYGKEEYVPGPELREISWGANNNDGYIKVEITFSEDLILSHGIGVIVDDTRDEENIRGFHYIKDSERYEAEAEFLESDKVIVKIPADAEAVSYAWADSALEANLYSEDRLPVVPFYEKR
ncbi:sialate O-acetylesterase [Lachnospiraceae bacterium]|nr:sialate O-acetylesterase [Lachnospiraceae bacterium]